MTRSRRRWHLASVDGIILYKRLHTSEVEGDGDVQNTAGTEPLRSADGSRASNNGPGIGGPRGAGGEHGRPGSVAISALALSRGRTTRPRTTRPRARWPR